MLSRTLPLALVALLPLSSCTTAGSAADTAGDAAAAVTGVVVDGADAIADFATYAYGETVGELGPARVPDNARVAVAEIRAPGDTTTGVVGEVVFVQTTDGVAVRYDIRGLEPGEHGFHVHQGASCAAADADNDGAVEAGGAAGGHFNPMNAPHGPRTAAMSARHVGDFGNITAGADRRAEGSFTDTVAMLDGMHSVAGHAIVVHARRDDLTSQPSGKADGRIGCGVVGLRGTTRE